MTTCDDCNIHIHFVGEINYSKMGITSCISYFEYISEILSLSVCIVKVVLILLWKRCSIHQINTVYINQSDPIPRFIIGMFVIIWYMVPNFSLLKYFERYRYRTNLNIIHWMWNIFNYYTGTYLVCFLIVIIRNVMSQLLVRNETYLKNVQVHHVFLSHYGVPWSC